jgi:hypothetical protein
MPDTVAMPVMTGQDAPNASGRDIATSDAAALSTARKAHAEALAKHQQALTLATKEGENARTIAGQRTALLARVEAGEPLNEKDLARARIAAVEADDIADIHASALDGALRKAHEADLAIRFAIAADHSARIAEAQREIVEAAGAADEAINNAGQALDTFNVLTAGLGQLDAEALQYLRYDLPEAVRSNPVLAAIPTPEHPKLHRVMAGRPNLSLITVRNHIAGHPC